MPVTIDGKDYYQKPLTQENSEYNSALINYALILNDIEDLLKTKKKYENKIKKLAKGGE